jgi:hypothetical protein
VRAEHLTGVYKNMNRGVVTLVFRCSVIGGIEHATSEARQVAWLTVDEAERSMVEARAIRVTDALATSSGPAVRVHDGTSLL